jgi:dolichol-phosphate mannosyltransferase
VSNRFAVIVPTFNEAGNITKLISGIYFNLPQATVIVVDHASPDRTADIACESRNLYPSLVVINRTGHRGLGDAYRIAYKYVLDHDFDYAIQMDADGSHDPARLADLCDAAQHFDLVVGSRHLPFSNRRHRTWLRRALSSCAQCYVNLWLHLPLSDATSGFRALSRRLLLQLSSSTLASTGFVIQIETAWIANKERFRLSEIPIDFPEREQGKSKLSWRIIAEAIWRVPWFKLQTSR